MVIGYQQKSLVSYDPVPLCIESLAYIKKQCKVVTERQRNHSNAERNHTNMIYSHVVYIIILYTLKKSFFAYDHRRQSRTSDLDPNATQCQSNFMWFVEQLNRTWMAPMQMNGTQMTNIFSMLRNKRKSYDCNYH